jgi:hypothetical protein
MGNTRPMISAYLEYFFIQDPQHRIDQKTRTARFPVWLWSRRFKRDLKGRDGDR